MTTPQNSSMLSPSLENDILHTDVLVIGGGAAGLSACLRLANAGQKVSLLYKTKQAMGASYWAQGGIAVALAPDDSFASHVEDTLKSGDGLCDEKAVSFVIENAKSQLDWMLEQGIKMTQKENMHNTDEGKPNFMNLHLTREGGHSKHRIVHADDATGKAIQTQLAFLVNQHPNITILPEYLALDLIIEQNTCEGVFVYHLPTQKVRIIHAQSTILATGGASRAYLYTTNPEVASGDGIAMGWRAGAKVANMEFNQFHPTCLYHLQSRTFLLTEALRGEGAFLRLPDGTRFMPNYHEMAELAPRDVVARAIDAEMKKQALDCVYLDISHRSSDFIQQHFPNIYQHCASVGIDLSKEGAPVVPAAHYTCGGLLTDLNAQTNIAHLYAIGEVACTGLHGANRIASNSLLECFVFADAATQHILNNAAKSTRDLPKTAYNQVVLYGLHKKEDEDTPLMIAHQWDYLRRIMWDYVGIVRNQKRLLHAKKHVAILREEIEEQFKRIPLNQDVIELRNLAQVAEIIILSALTRKESRGLHFNTDYPQHLPKAVDTVLSSQAPSLYF